VASNWDRHSSLLVAETEILDLLVKALAGFNLKLHDLHTTGSAWKGHGSMASRSNLKPAAAAWVGQWLGV
jgi:hypothetical protein